MRTPRGTLRSSLLTSLLAVAVAMSLVFLLLVRSLGERQIQRSLSDDVERSLATFQTIEQQRQTFLVEAARLIADLPSLKALLTTADPSTVQDGGTEYWQTSGSDLFALLSPSGDVLALYTAAAPLQRSDAEAQLRRSLASRAKATSLFSAGRLFSIALSPVYFVSGSRTLLLGYVAIGYEVDSRLAHEVSRASSSEAIFIAGSSIVTSTLAAAPKAEELAELTRQPGARQARKVTLAGEDYLASSILLAPPAPATPAITLVLCKPVRQATLLLRQLNGGIAALGLIAVVAGATLALWLAGSVTRPLEALLRSTRAFGLGHMEEAVPEGGPRELRELSVAFEGMRIELRRKQAELLTSERLATIGRMASSVSHDLRHYLSPIYANAEFLGSRKISAAEHGELLEEIITAARGMTDLLDSLLVFSRTGETLEPHMSSVSSMLKRAVATIRAHPAARGVAIELVGVPAGDAAPVLAIIDAKELQRAVYNLLLNACQAAAGRAAATSQAMSARVELALESTFESISIHVRDNGPGVPEGVRARLFQPFTSEGKESGIGLGLAIVKRIAEAHGGTVSMQRRDRQDEHMRQAAGWETEFSIVIPTAGPPDIVRQALPPQDRSA